jgi:hypothetical protein
MIGWLLFGVFILCTMIGCFAALALAIVSVIWLLTLGSLVPGVRGTKTGKSVRKLSLLTDDYGKIRTADGLKALGAAAAATAILIPAALFLEGTEPVKWVNAEIGNNPTTYVAYLSRYPNGRHAEEANTRLAGITGQRARNFTGMMARCRKGSIGERMTRYFASQPPTGRWKIDLIQFKARELPGQYDLFSWPDAGSYKEPVEDYSHLAGAEFAEVDRRAPPYDDVTLVREYSGRPYGSYVRRDSPDALEGIILTVRVSLYLPGAQQPAATFDAEAAPASEVGVYSAPAVAVLDRESLFRHVVAKSAGQLRSELCL